MITTIPAARRRRVAAAAAGAGADSFLITHLPDVRYLCGFTGSNAALALRGSRATLVTDGRYTAQANAEVDGARVVIAQKSAVEIALALLTDGGAQKVAFDAAHTTVDGLARMRTLLPRALRRTGLVATSGLVAHLRTVKDEAEQDRLRAAAALGCRLFDQVLEHIVPGATEMEVALALEYMARLEGVESMAFETIVASGERSALPHGRATSARLPRRGFVTLDFGVVLDGYVSDMTRTVHMGAPRRGEREAYEAVLEAQLAGVAAVRAGVTGAQVDEAARGVLRSAGFEEWFTHSTGHGLGIEIHESPRLGKLQNDLLRAGMVVTIEPGIYMPGRFGVRIEDTVLVTKTGCEILTPTTKAWIEL